MEISTQWEGRRGVSMLHRTDFMGNKLLVKEAREKVASEGDSHKNLENSVIRMEREGLMNSQRLEWVMSGLNLHTLTKTEDQFVKTALEDFNKNQALTEHQEEKLENLYKEKSKLIPNKNLSPVKESSPKKAKPRKPPWKSRMDM